LEFFHPGAFEKLVETGMTVRRQVGHEALQTIARCIGEPPDWSPSTNWDD
jgi:hypothetical protein